MRYNKAMNGDIDKLIKYIAEHFVFDENTYPELANATDREKHDFAIRHLSLHFSKTAGNISSVSESADHGEEVDIDKIKENIPKSLINTLRLAELVGMREEEIISKIKEKYSEK